MKKLLEYVPFHFLVCVIIGIIIQFYTNVWKYDFLLLASTMFLFFCSLFFLKKYTYRKTFSLVSLVFFIYIGVAATFLNTPTVYRNYYQHHTSKNNHTILCIKKILKANKLYYKYIAEVIQINDKKTIGNVLLNVKKENDTKLLKIDHLIYLKSVFKKLPEPLNPYQFNYKEYLSKQYIYHQVFAKRHHYKVLAKSTTSIYGLAENLSSKIQASLNDVAFTNDQLSIIEALVLGKRQRVSKDLLESYTNAGAIHILAISGLHIGIILLILSYVLSPIEKLKYGAIIKVILLILLLWSFAVITGFSSSVVRATTMFTFVAIGESFSKKKVIEHSLISSMLFLLILKPLYLLDIGFQLSYLAVFGIVWIQPLLNDIYTPKSWILNKFWKLCTVSFAAQIGVLPLSLYYFNQFPILFILSNLIIIPFLGGFIIGGILIIVLALSNLLPKVLVDIYGTIISLMNKVVVWISDQKLFLLQGFSISFFEMILWYVAIIFSYHLIRYRKTKYVLLLLSSLVTIQLSMLYEKYKQESKQELIVFHTNNENLVGIRSGNTLKINKAYDSLKVFNKSLIKRYCINEDIEKLISKNIPNIINYNSNTILSIDNLGVYKLPINQPIIILTGSPKINLNRLINLLNPKQIIADGSNYKNLINSWKTTCKEQKTPFHHTRQNGAYIIKLHLLD